MEVAAQQQPQPEPVTALVPATPLAVPSDEPTKEIDAQIPLAPEYLIKHPLQNTWILWFFEQTKGSDWSAGQKEITQINTVEDFWSVYNHIKLASELKQGCDYSLFKSGIKPMWEDPQNINGGRWLLVLDRRHRGSDLDQIWLDVCLSLIGEALKLAEEISGAVINLRPKQDKINLWTRTPSSNSSSILELGADFKEKLKLDRFSINYISHKDQKRAGSSPKYMYTL